MQKEQILVFGEKPSDINLDFLNTKHRVIVAGKNVYPARTNYICLNNVHQIDAAIKNRPNNAIIMAPKLLYSKYVFHEFVECLPDFKELDAYGWNSEAVSQQLLSLGFGMWLGAEIVYLFGYNLEMQKEVENLQAMIQLYPATEFVYVYKTMPKFNFKELKNFSLRSYDEFRKKVIKHE
jgi:hypothetical protein